MRCKDFDQSYWREFMQQAELENPPEHLLEHLEQCADCKKNVELLFQKQFESSQPGAFSNRIELSAQNLEPSESLIERLKRKCLEEPGLSGAPLSEFQKLGHYVVLHELGHGGMNKVYCCMDETLGRQVAVKIFPQVNFDHNRRERMQREARLQAAINHPNIVRLLEVNTEFETPFIVMELMRGGSLKELKQNGPVPPRLAAAYMETIARAVHFAHENGVLHRDLKSSNILIENPVHGDEPFPEDLTLKIADFGLARAIGTDSELTASNMLVGTPAYMSPEQTKGDSTRLTPASDIYALGAILYDLLVGRAPIIVDDLRLTLAMIRETPPISPRLLQPNVNKDLETICLKCLEKEPERRYATARALADDLKRFQSGLPINARPVSEIFKAWRWCQRNRMLAGSLMVAFVSLAALVGGAIEFLASRERFKTESVEIRTQSRKNSIEAIEIRKRINDEAGRGEIDYLNSIRATLGLFQELSEKPASALTPELVEGKYRTFKGQSIIELQRIFNRIENDFTRPEASIQVCGLLASLLNDSGANAEANTWMDRMTTLVLNYPEMQKVDPETMTMVYRVLVTASLKAKSLPMPDQKRLEQIKVIYRAWPLDRLSSKASEELTGLRGKLGEIVDEK